MLERVRINWITGVLEPSINEGTPIIMDLQEMPDAIDTSLEASFSQRDAPPYMEPLSNRIKEVYKRAGGELLILGELGSGKTTLVLELARDLLEAAERDVTHPMPVVFNLSSWALKQLPLADWLVEELYSKYQVSRPLARSWVEDNQVLPLLDGLDEVTPPHLTKCVETINAYRKDHGLVPIAVCCRSNEYFAQETRLRLHLAIQVELLTTEQIDDYLLSLGDQYALLRVAIRKDPVLQELATRPLMLSIMASTYKTPTADLLEKNSSMQRKRKIFAAYVDRKLKIGDPKTQRQDTKIRFPARQSLYWLAWLAEQMRQRNQFEFYIERMQPNLLPGNRLREIYRSVVERMLPGLFLGLVIGFLVGLFFFISGLLSATSAKGVSARGIDEALYHGLIYGSVGGLISGLLIAFVGGQQTEIKPVEAIAWSLTDTKLNWKNFVKGGVLCGLLLGVLAQLIGGSTLGLVVSLLGVVFGGLIFGLTSGLSSRMLDKRKLVRPNEGIRRSAIHALLVGLLCGLCGGLLFRWAVGQSAGSGAGLRCGLVVGVVFGLVSGLSSGGDACLAHVVLRLLLTYAGYMPWNYPGFLNYAAERKLLRRVGGGYIFAHPELRDYFASLDTSLPLEKAAEQEQDVSSP